MYRSIVLAVALLIAAPASAEIYKWIDDNGVTHYGQKPPMTRTVEEVNVASARPSAGVRPVPADVQEAADAFAAEIMKNTESADSLDCDQSVENARYSLDSMMEVGRDNFEDGYVAKADYDKAEWALKKLKSSISVAECRNSGGSVRDFYLCMTNPNNHVAACGEKHNYEP